MYIGKSLVGPHICEQPFAAIYVCMMVINKAYIIAKSVIIFRFSICRGLEANATICSVIECIINPYQFIFATGRDDNTHVALKFMDSAGGRVRETVYGREYSIRAELTKPNGTLGLKVKNCFAFSKKNSTLKLIDDRGCTLDANIISRFKENADGVSATAMMRSMFKFPDGSEVHLQCDVVPCMVAGCAAMEPCDGTGVKGSRALAANDDLMMLAATTVFVLDPADAPCKCQRNQGDQEGRNKNIYFDYSTQSGRYFQYKLTEISFLLSLQWSQPSVKTVACDRHGCYGSQLRWASYS